MSFKTQNGTKNNIYDIKIALKNGLEKQGYTIDELQKNWIKRGSDGGKLVRGDDGEFHHTHPARLRYWKQHQNYRCISIKIPFHDRCPCGQRLHHENAYLTKKAPNSSVKFEYLTIGSCCIKTFMPNGLKKICEDCGNPHKNRKDNKCKSCRQFHKNGRKCPGWGNPKYGGTNKCNNVCGTYRDTAGKLKYYKRCAECTKSNNQSWERYKRIRGGSS